MFFSAAVLRSDDCETWSREQRVLYKVIARLKMLLFAFNLVLVIEACSSASRAYIFVETDMITLIDLVKIRL